MALNAPSSSKSSQGQTPATTVATGNGRIRRGEKSEPQSALESSQSAELRDKLISELGDITSAEDAATWAKHALAAKNSLTTSDAGHVEAAFERKLAKFPPTDAAASPKDQLSTNAVRAEVIEGGHDGGIDKSALAIAAARRYRNREHLRFVMRQPCLICGRKPSDPHHLRYMQPRALGRKASDEFAVPLCRVHHRAAHRAGDERAWWSAAGIDPIKIARKLWTATRENEGRTPPIPMTRTREAGAAQSAASPDADAG